MIFFFVETEGWFRRTKQLTNHAMQNCLLRDSVIILTKRHCSVIQSEKKRVVYCSMLADRRSPKRLYCVFSVQLTEFSRTNAQP